jgi:hypothetical protein
MTLEEIDMEELLLKKKLEKQLGELRQGEAEILQADLSI